MRKEIVGTRFTTEEANPREKAAPKITPEELHAWYAENKDFVVIDMRNSYEYASGHFKNAIESHILASRDLPRVIHTLEEHKKKQVVTPIVVGEVNL